MAKNSEQRDIIAAKNKMFFSSIVITVGLVIGIPCIPVGFATGRIWLGVIGIVLVAVGFYGTPLMWIGYGTMTRQVKLYTQIEVSGVIDVPTLCRYYNLSEKTMLQNIQKLIDKKYLVNHVIVGNKLAVYDKNDFRTATIDMTATVTAQCPYCSGKVPMIDGKGFCPYCGSLVTSELAQAAIVNEERVKANIPNSQKK